VQRWYGPAWGGLGLLLLSGVVARQARVAGRTATELLGAGDLLRPWDASQGDPVACEVAWRVLVAADVAVLDARFAARVRPWPQIASSLAGRVIRRADGLAVQRAIASHPRVDVRVSMLLWHLAGRWGRVQPDASVHLPLPLSHRLMGELVGAERPSVSHAVGRLSRAGLISRSGDGWSLRGTPDEHAALATRPGCV
jgi:hypothetical protein